MDGNAIKKMLESLATHVGVGSASAAGEQLTVVFDFAERGFGFGEVTLVQASDGLYVDTETMGAEKVLGLFRIMLGQAVLDTDQDPGKHRRYNDVMGRGCGPSCRVCSGAAP